VPDYLLDCNHLSAALRKVSAVRERIHQGRTRANVSFPAIPFSVSWKLGFSRLRSRTTFAAGDAFPAIDAKSLSIHPANGHRSHVLDDATQIFVNQTRMKA
jgi:hypothetical protein